MEVLVVAEAPIEVVVVEAALIEVVGEVGVVASKFLGVEAASIEFLVVPKAPAF